MKKIALTTVQMALGFASRNFSVALQFFPKLHSRQCDYMYIGLKNNQFQIPVLTDRTVD